MLETPIKSHLARPAIQESSFNENYNKFGESYYEEEEFMWDNEFSSNSSSLSILSDKDKEKRISIPIASNSSRSTMGCEIFAFSQSTSARSSIISTQFVSRTLF